MNLKLNSKTTLRLDQITVDDAMQARVAVDDSIVEEYAELMRSGHNFPSVEVVFDGKLKKHYLVDGFHRLAAARRAGIKTIGAVVTDGSMDEARWLSCGANKNHGLRRTNADKRKAIRAALMARPELSDTVLAAHVGVSNGTVGSYRAELAEAGVIRDVQVRTGLDGRKNDIKKNNDARKARIAALAERTKPTYEHCPTCRGSGMVKKR